MVLADLKSTSCTAQLFTETQRHVQYICMRYSLSCEKVSKGPFAVDNLKRCKPLELSIHFCVMWEWLRKPSRSSFLGLGGIKCPKLGTCELSGSRFWHDRITPMLIPQLRIYFKFGITAFKPSEYKIHDICFLSGQPLRMYVYLCTARRGFSFSLGI